MIGSIKPIAELVVAPKIVIASPILGMAKERLKLIRTMIKVTITFYLGVNFYSASRNTSSKVSLQGKIVRGVAKSTTVRIPNRDI